MIKLGYAKLIPLNPAYKKNYTSIQDTICGLVDELYKKARYKITDERFYPEISHSTLNNTAELNGKAIALTISQDSDKYNGHMLEISMLLPSDKVIKRPLAYGDSKTILDFLNSKDSIKTIKSDLLAMSSESV